MIDCLYIIHRGSGRLLLEKRFEEVKIDPDLFSGLLEAIRNFIKEIHVGILTSFTTHEKQVLISLTENVVVALIMHIEAHAEQWHAIAYEIGKVFDKNYDLLRWNGNRDIFKPFEHKIDFILQNQKDNLVIQVAKWAEKEFGGHIHIDQALITDEYGEVPIDIVIDCGEVQDVALREKLLKKRYKGYERNILFFRVIEGTIGLDEIKQFLESCKHFGYECHKEGCERIFNNFPTKIIIVARDFSPIALSHIHDFMQEDKKLNKHYILSNHLKHLLRFSLHRRLTRLFNCYIELWEWKTPHPECVFF